MRPRSKSHLLATVLLGLVVAAPSPAAVTDATAQSFAVEFDVTVAGDPVAAYAKLTAEISRWWDSAHTWSGDARNLSLDARAGGCFCERLPGNSGTGADGSVQHGQVVFAQPGKLLRLNAALGPFQQFAVIGVLTFRFTAEGKATRVTVNYQVSGAMSPEPAKLGPMAEGMLSSQMKRFQTFVETGTPAK